jgi:hypothetical protein
MGAWAFDSWRREFVGKRRMELAEDTLSAFYQAKDVVEMMRSPIGFGEEGSSRKPGPDEWPEDKKALDGAYVLIERYNRHSELFARIQSQAYRFRALFGDKAAQPFADLSSVVSELIMSAHKVGRLRTWRGTFRTPGEADAFAKQVQEAERIFWSGCEDDKVAGRVDVLVQEMERTCKAVIESRYTLFAMFNAKMPRWLAAGIVRLTRR